MAIIIPDMHLPAGCFYCMFCQSFHEMNAKYITYRCQLTGKNVKKTPVDLHRQEDCPLRDADCKDLIDGRQLHSHLNDVWLSNTPTNPNNPPEENIYQNGICQGIIMAMEAIEEHIEQNQGKEAPGDEKVCSVRKEENG